MLVDQAEFNALREIVRENTGDEMMLLNRFTVRGMRHALGMEQEAGIETLVRNGVIVEKAGHYEFAPEIQRALVREELGDSLRVAEAITRLRLGKQTTGIETPDMQKGAYRGEILGSSKWHVVQRVGNSQTVVAHLKNRLEPQAVLGTVEITYSQGKGAVTQIEERQRRHAHGKELALRRQSTMQMNRVVIAGYVSKTAQVRRLPSGTALNRATLTESYRFGVWRVTSKRRRG